MVSIRDVSAAAGVSVATVSRALTMPDRVAKATRDRVLKVTEELGYHPNLVARSLRSQQSRLIVVLVTNIANPMLSRCIRGIEKLARELGYSVLLGDTQNDNLIEASYIRLLAARQVDGVILLSSRLHGRVTDLILKANPQAAVVNACACLDVTPCSTVGIDDVGSARVMTEHLLSLGHRRIAVLTGPEESPHSRDRMFGYRLQLRAAGVQFDESLVVSGEFTMKSGADAVDRVLAIPTRPTALFCFNDEMAIGAIQRLTALGHSVPGDISVAGFDDIEFAAFTSPALTTIHQPTADMGTTAMNLLHRRLSGEMQVETVTLPTELMIRQTTAPPRAEP
ncbi:LacI family transcriptional regulator [Phenylobacterium hankyongense]|uniref:LacI family transcriptional regulator n=1 Tax=Phenylobacterium hankyongense TaxID=1813876 RepID=A0A328B1R9_9CAUL|nr:LacI family DNA-binding transcriptional regulator [Phenylobacterium hankyongense]RAK58948.1 LacI family transcriptional regulator [Phenylobacterium hankyongense]